MSPGPASPGQILSMPVAFWYQQPVWVAACPMVKTYARLELVALWLMNDGPQNSMEKVLLSKIVTKCQKMEVCRYAAVAAMLNAFLCMCQVFWTFPQSYHDHGLVAWTLLGLLYVPPLCIHGTVFNIASSPCACVKKCQSNSYLTSFWPEGIFKIFLKCYW